MSQLLAGLAAFGSFVLGILVGRFILKLSANAKSADKMADDDYFGGGL